LELIRYIHLNPLRAKLVEDLKSLDKYPWSGHSAILGRRKNPLIPKLEKEVSSADKRIGFSQFHLETEKAIINPENPVDPVKNKSLAEKTIEDVLKYFGKSLKEARRRYRVFVEKGIKQGRRTDLQGGGLVRSSGGDKAGLLGQKKEEREKGDARILGSGDFVSATLHQSEKLLGRKYGPKKSIDDLIKVVAEESGLSPELICSGSRKTRISNARSIVAHMAIEEIGHSATDVAKHLGIRQTSVLQSVKKGKILCGRVDLHG
jgi:hypothetical protein